MRFSLISRDFREKKDDVWRDHVGLVREQEPNGTVFIYTVEEFKVKFQLNEGSIRFEPSKTLGKSHASLSEAIKEYLSPIDYKKFIDKL